MSFDPFLVLTLTLVGIPSASTAPLVVDTANDELPSKSLGLEVEFEVMSIYNDRGTNVFSTTDQLEQGLNVGSSLGYAFGESGAFVEAGLVMQLAGTDPEGMVRTGANAEHNFTMGIERALWADRLKAGAQLLVIMYPFADGALVQDFIPTILEPSVFVETTSVIDIGLELTYSLGVQPELSSGRFLYVRPHVARSFAVSRAVDVGGSFGAGYKFFEQPHANPDRRIDLEASVHGAVDVGRWSVSPALSAAWTDLAGEDFGAGIMVWASVAISTQL